MRKIRGIEVPKIASSADLREIVGKIYESCGKNYCATGRAIGVHADTVRKLLIGKQEDSQIVRQKLGLRKTKPRPRVWMPTNNCEAATKKLFEHYEPKEIYETICEIGSHDNIRVNVEVSEILNIDWSEVQKSIWENNKRKRGQ